LPDDGSEIFLREGMDRVLGDLPVGLLCRGRAAGFDLRERRISVQRSSFVGWVSGA